MKFPSSRCSRQKTLLHPWLLYFSLDPAHQQIMLPLPSKYTENTITSHYTYHCLSGPNHWRLSSWSPFIHPCPPPIAFLLFFQNMSQIKTLFWSKALVVPFSLSIKANDFTRSYMILPLSLSFYLPQLFSFTLLHSYWYGKDPPMPEHLLLVFSQESMSPLCNWLTPAFPSDLNFSTIFSMKDSLIQSLIEGFNKIFNNYP